MTLLKNKSFFKMSTFFLLFCGFFLGFNNGNAFAVDDYSVTLDWDSITAQYLCGGDSGRSCSDYSYFITTPSNNCSINGAAFYVSGLGNPNVSGNDSVPVCTESIIPFSSTSAIYITGGRYLADRYSGNFTVKLASNYGFVPTGNIEITQNGTVDVSSYATATVNVPQTEIIEDPISNDFQKVFFKIVEKIIPAFGIFVVIWFGIDILSSLIFGRGR